MTFKQLFTSSIGKKLTMGLTGLFLVTFLIVHAGVNSCIFVNDGGETFNAAAHFMSHNWVIRVMEIGLFAGLLAHIIQGLLLWKQNNNTCTNLCQSMHICFPCSIIATFNRIVK